MTAVFLLTTAMAGRLSDWVSELERLQDRSLSEGRADLLRLARARVTQELEELLHFEVPNPWNDPWNDQCVPLPLGSDGFAIYPSSPPVDAAVADPEPVVPSGQAAVASPGVVDTAELRPIVRLLVQLSWKGHVRLYEGLSGCECVAGP